MWRGGRVCCLSIRSMNGHRSGAGGVGEVRGEDQNNEGLEREEPGSQETRGPERGEAAHDRSKLKNCTTVNGIMQRLIYESAEKKKRGRNKLLSPGRTGVELWGPGVTYQ